MSSDTISVAELGGYALTARDGDIGAVRDLYFDDARWVVRQIVVRTGNWLSHRDVLISPHAIRSVDRDAQRLEVDLTRQQVKDAPDVDHSKPVSRVQEMALHDHYGYPNWWVGTQLWGDAAYPLADVAPDTARTRADPVERELEARKREELQAADPHLRSCREVTGYSIAANDGAAGHVADFLFDARSWQLRWLDVDTRDWLPGRHVLIPPQFVQRVDWAQHEVHVALTCEAVRSSPSREKSERASKSHLEQVQRHFEGWE